MPNKKLLLLSVTAGLLISALLAVFLLKTSAQKSSAQKQPDARPRAVLPEAKTMDKPLPVARLADLEGRDVSPDELRRGRYLLVFMTAGCSPCVEEAGSISRLLQSGSSPLHVVGVGVENAGRVADFVRENDIKFPVILDKNAELREALDVRIFPSKYLVEDGVVKKAWYGTAADEAVLRGQLALAEVK